MRYAIAIIVGYLLGNISFSTIYAKIFAKGYSLDGQR